MESFLAVKLFHQLAARFGMTPPDLGRVEGGVTVAHLRAGEHAFRQGEAHPHVYVVRTGLLKQYFLTEDGDAWTKSFTAEGQLFACPFALRAGGRTTFASVAIEASVIECVNYRMLEVVAEEDVRWQKFIRLGFQLLSEIKVLRERDLLTLTAEALYAKVAAESPELVHRIPQKELAAYLGVTPVGLNRIVRRVNQQAAHAPSPTLAV